jgi:hypothetical protein
MSKPPVISPGPDGASWWTPGIGLDPAKYLLRPGEVTSPGKHTAGQWAHARPYISNGSSVFVFPVGPEGFTDQGQTTLGLHKYIGDENIDGVIVHREESRITLTGIFPGLTSVQNRIDCRAMLRQIPKDMGLILWVPGVFGQEQFVLPESWTFEHGEDDRSHSITYAITFVRIGTRKHIADPSGSIPPPQPGTKKTKPKGKPARIYTIRSSVRTLRGVAKVVYHDYDAWPRLVRLNEGQLNAWKKKHPSVPNYKIPTYRWPIGTKFRY